MAEIIVDIGDNLVETIGCEFKGELVRCKECKYYDNEDYGEPTRYCTWHESVVNADDYCSYGVRKTNTTAEEKPTPIRDYMVHGEREGE